MSEPVPWTREIPHLRGRWGLVREVQTSDAATLLELLSDPAVTAHLAPPPRSAEAMAGFVTWSQQERATARSVCFGIVPYGLCTAVGIIQVRALEPTWFTAEWGFAIGRAFWSTGVFVEAATLVAGFAFDCLRVDRLEARAVVDNDRGHGVLQKLGARAEGRLAKSFRVGNRTANQILWSLRAEDWRQSTPAQPRLSADEATAQIASAIARTRQVFDDQRLREKTARPYPFFLTD